MILVVYCLQKLLFTLVLLVHRIERVVFSNSEFKMVVCSVCKHETNYRCISCQVSICNRNLDCHVPVKEDTIPGWIHGKQVALCHVCDLEQTRMSQEVADMHFEMKCASRGFHAYRSVWKPRIEENLQMKPEFANVHDPFAIAITASSPETLTKYDVVGHVPREISRFCRYFLNSLRRLTMTFSLVIFRRRLVEFEDRILLVCSKYAVVRLSSYRRVVDMRLY